MTEHAAVWTPDSPTPGQLKEVFSQIQSGRITKENLGLFLKNVKPRTEFPITLWGDISVEDLLVLGKYYIVGGRTQSKLPPINMHRKAYNCVVELVEFDHDPTVDELLEEFERLGLEQPTVEAALYFGIHYPDEQGKNPIIFLHKPVEDSDDLGHVLVLGLTDKKRSVDFLRGIGFGISKHGLNCEYVFAGVRPVEAP